MTTKYLVVIPNAWGVGPTAIEAANVARRELGRASHRKTMPAQYIVYTFDPAATPTCYVNEMGSLCWAGAAPRRVDSRGVGR